jgi:hypothetical protein
MTIEGHLYTSDLLIFPDGKVVASWWRAAGHRLTLQDIESLVDAGPELLIAGLGIYGRMKPAPELKQTLADQGIALVTAWNKTAVKQFNSAVKAQSKVGGCFHLTC